MNTSVTRLITVALTLAVTTVGGMSAAQAQQGADDATTSVSQSAPGSDDTAARAASDDSSAGSDDPAATVAADDSTGRSAAAVSDDATLQARRGADDSARHLRGTHRHQVAHHFGRSAHA